MAALSGIESVELRAWRDDLREKAIWLGVAWLYAVGVLLAGGGDYFAVPETHIGLAVAAFILAGGVGLLSRLNRTAAAAALIPACMLLILAVAIEGQLTVALVLMVFPVWLAALAFGKAACAGVAGLCTLLIWHLAISGPWLAAATVPLRVTAALAVWGTVGLVWLLADSLLTTSQWAWANYKHAQTALEDAREHQMQLNQALEDRDTVNLQLTRLNRLAQGLRQIAEDERHAKERFVANVSHELRTPLNMIIGFCEMMLNSPKTYGGRRIPQTLLADLSVVLRNSQHLAELINDVLDLSQIEAGRISLTKERVALAEIIQAATTAIRPLLDSKGLYLEVQLTAGLPPVFCDRTRIREVVLNLLSNAGRFTEQGGVTVCVRQEGSDVVVSVADTGRGIADHDQERIFQPFEQLDATIRRRYGGTGLGLSISRGFVELHEGKMWVESEPGRGATFSFRLPIDPPAPFGGVVGRWLNPHQPYEERGRPWRLPPTTVRPRLVVVERGSVLRRLLSRYLDGVEIVALPNLASALQDLAHTPAQVLVVNELAETPQPTFDLNVLPREIPVIACAIPDTEIAAETLGAVGYLVKPIAQDALLGALARQKHKVHSVLVVDDEPDALQLFARMLAEGQPNCRVLRASNGRQALQICRHDPPDVILLDLVMPEMDGFEFLAAKGNDPALQSIPTILISARDPSDQPIVSRALSVRRAGGLSVQDLVAAIEALTAILGRTPFGRATGELSADPAPPATPHG
jgi:signal transduction histidine kinase/AmiR/NasT family two-component response regulator